MVQVTNTIIKNLKDFLMNYLVLHIKSNQRIKEKLPLTKKNLLFKEDCLYLKKNGVKSIKYLILLIPQTVDKVVKF